MKIVLSPGHVEDLLDHLADLTDRARTQHRQLRQRRVTDRDGYPTSSMGGGGSPTNELDADGTPLPQRSDPTARVVIERDEAADPAGHALATVIGHLTSARHHLQLADGAATEALSPPVKPPREPSDVWCKSCLRANAHTPRAEGCADYCRWCYDWRRAHNRELPWLELIDLRQRGVRLTTARILEVERARHQTKKKRKAKRR